jgi:hypothetical protein
MSVPPYLMAEGDTCQFFHIPPGYFYQYNLYGSIFDKKCEQRVIFVVKSIEEDAMTSTTTTRLMVTLMAILHRMAHELPLGLE